MNKKLLAVCLFVGVSAGMSACNEGEYNDLKCDSTYVAECLTADRYMHCGADGRLVVTACDANSRCSMETGVAACKANGITPAVCTEGDTKCANGRLSKCTKGTWDAGVACSKCNADGKRCDDNATPAEGTLGGACRADGATVCDSGLVCDGDTRKCREPAAGSEGGACRDGGNACDSGLVCNASNICAKPEGTLNGACREVSEGVTACDSGLICDEGNTCVEAKPAGTESAICRAEGDPNGRCDSGLVCNSSGICERGQTPVAGSEGAPCRVETDEVLACDVGLSCNASGICAKECATDNDCPPEKGKAVCDLSTHACVECTAERAEACSAGNAVGPVCIQNVCAKCTDDVQCGEGKTCNKVSGKCEVGEIECNDMISCKDPNKVCKNNKCVDPETSQHECNDDDAQCGDGKICVAGKCSVKPVVGEACDASTFVDACDGIRAMFVCDQNDDTSPNKVISLGCASEYSCWYRPDGKPECVEPCTDLNEGDIQHADCDHVENAAYNYICSKDFYGRDQLFAFENVNACGSEQTCSAPADPKSGTRAVCK